MSGDLRFVEEPGATILYLAGRLDAETVPVLWRRVLGELQRRQPARLVVGAAEVGYCDGAGIGLLLELACLQQERGAEVEIRGLAPEFRNLLELFDPARLPRRHPVPKPRTSFPEEVGRATWRLLQGLGEMIAFTGELTVALFAALRRPQRLRWHDTMLVAEKAGVNALPIIALVSFLVGLIMAFQAAIPMRQFGAEIYVANLIGLSMLRELGPLMTAIVLAGRSGSAFAAELGTMKINEEIDALGTMGLDPVRFLVVSRVLAALAVTPLLTIFADLLGIMGGSVVLLSLGFPLGVYINQVLFAVTLADFLTGLFKAFIFGIIVAGIGCLHGLQTGTGASAVGDSATRAVVSGIILIVITDGIFSVVFYYLAI